MVVKLQQGRGKTKQLISDGSREWAHRIRFIKANIGGQFSAFAIPIIDAEMLDRYLCIFDSGRSTHPTKLMK